MSVFRPAGFNLIELMVVLAIAATLYLVALPTYQYAVLKSNRAAARAALMDVAARQEQHFINSKQYALSLAMLGLTEPYYIDGQAQSVGEELAIYRISLDIEDAIYRGVRATPLHRQAEDSRCMTFALNRTGVRRVSGSFSSNPRDCW